MGCYWQELLNLLPQWMKDKVDKLGRENLQELRLRIGYVPELWMGKESLYLGRPISGEDLSFCVNMATRYSPWTSSGVSHGFITAIGGHRIGLCGECVYEGDKLRNIPVLTSLCIRVARDHPDVSGLTYRNGGSILIIGPPGCGKTTFLRDLIRKTSDHFEGAVTVVDQRRELFPHSGGKFLFPRGKRTDVLSGADKAKGLDMAIRTMGPKVVAVDEITEYEDCKALEMAAKCGVRLFATAHAGSRTEYMSREVYKPLRELTVFDRLIVMDSSQNWKEEFIP